MKITGSKLTFCLSLAFFLHRIITMTAAPFDSFSSEELFTGTMAQMILKNLPVPWYLRSMGPQEIIGRNILAYLTAASFSLLSPSLFALKFPVILISTLGFFVWQSVIQRFFSKTASLISAFFWIFSPRMITSLSTIAFGNHWESVTNLGILLLLACQWRSKPSYTIWLYLISICSGLSISMCYSSIPFVLAITLPLLKSNSSAMNLTKSISALFLFLSGVFPAVYGSICRTGKIIAIYNVTGKSISTTLTLSHQFDRLVSLWFNDIPKSYISSEASYPSHVLGTISFLLLIFTSLSAFFKTSPSENILYFKKTAAMVFMLYTVFWSVSGVIDPPIGYYVCYRYFAGLYPFAWVLAAVTLTGWMKSRRKLQKGAAIALISLIILPGTLDTFHRCRSKPFHLVHSASGESWILSGLWLSYLSDTHSQSFSRMNSYFKELEPWRKQLCALGNGIYCWSKPSTRNIRLPDLIRDFKSQAGGADLLSYFLKGIPTGMHFTQGISTNAILREILTAPELDRPHLMEGYGMLARLVDTLNKKQMIIRKDSVPDQYHNDFARGYGYQSQMEILMEDNPEHVMCSREAIPVDFSDSEAREFAIGSGLCLGEYFPLKPEPVLDLIRYEFPDHLAGYAEWSYLGKIIL